MTQNNVAHDAVMQEAQNEIRKLQDELELIDLVCEIENPLVLSPPVLTSPETPQAISPDESERFLDGVTGSQEEGSPNPGFEPYSLEKTLSPGVDVLVLGYTPEEEGGAHFQDDKGILSKGRGGALLEDKEGWALLKDEEGEAFSKDEGGALLIQDVGARVQEQGAGASNVTATFDLDITVDAHQGAASFTEQICESTLPTTFNCEDTVRDALRDVVRHAVRDAFGDSSVAGSSLFVHSSIRAGGYSVSHGGISDTQTHASGGGVVTKDYIVPTEVSTINVFEPDASIIAVPPMLSPVTCHHTWSPVEGNSSENLGVSRDDGGAEKALPDEIFPEEMEVGHTRPPVDNDADVAEEDSNAVNTLDNSFELQDGNLSTFSGGDWQFGHQAGVDSLFAGPDVWAKVKSVTSYSPACVCGIKKGDQILSVGLSSKYRYGTYDEKIEIMNEEIQEARKCGGFATIKLHRDNHDQVLCLEANLNQGRGKSNDHGGDFLGMTILPIHPRQYEHSTFHEPTFVKSKYLDFIVHIWFVRIPRDSLFDYSSYRFCIKELTQTGGWFKSMSFTSGGAVHFDTDSGIFFVVLLATVLVLPIKYCNLFENRFPHKDHGPIRTLRFLSVKSVHLLISGPGMKSNTVQC